MIRCHSLVDVFFAAKTLRNYKPNMVETLVRGRVPCPAISNFQVHALSTQSLIPAPTIGLWFLILWCQNSYPVSHLSPERVVVAHACPLSPHSPSPLLERDQVGDSFSPSPQDQYHFCYDVALEYLEGLESR